MKPFLDRSMKPGIIKCTVNWEVGCSCFNPGFTLGQIKRLSKSHSWHSSLQQRAAQTGYQLRAYMCAVRATSLQTVQCVTCFLLLKSSIDFRCSVWVIEERERERVCWTCLVFCLLSPISYLYLFLYGILLPTGWDIFSVTEREVSVFMCLGSYFFIGNNFLSYSLLNLGCSVVLVLDSQQNWMKITETIAGTTIQMFPIWVTIKCHWNQVLFNPGWFPEVMNLNLVLCDAGCYICDSSTSWVCDIVTEMNLRTSLIR
jgi:hypothetical protein